jgi:probable F420-dependent oxidoreductase
MAPKLGYLLPTREAIMNGRPEAKPLMELATRAELLGYDSVWIGDSLLAKPRHDPLTLLAGVAGRTRRVTLGTAVLLPALRNPVVLAHQVATLDQVSEGRLVLGVGIAQDHPSVRAEFMAAGVPFEKRVGRMLEGLRLCRALWTGEPVDWDGRWKVEAGTLGPTPHRPGGPPIWIGGGARANLGRVARHFDGWFPISPDPESWGAQWQEIQAMARDAGRAPDAITGAFYLTLAVDDDTRRAEKSLDQYLEAYYGQSAEVLKSFMTCYAGSSEGAAQLLDAYASAGVSHMVLRFAGDHDRLLETMIGIRESLGWASAS